MKLDSNPHVTHTETLVEIQSDGSIKRVLLVGTSLSLQPGEERFDSSELDDLVDAISEEIRDSFHDFARLKHGRP